MPKEVRAASCINGKKGNCKVAVFSFEKLIAAYQITFVKMDIEREELNIKDFSLFEKVRVIGLEYHCSSGQLGRSEKLHKGFLDCGFSVVQMPIFENIYHVVGVYIRE